MGHTTGSGQQPLICGHGSLLMRWPYGLLSGHMLGCLHLGCRLAAPAVASAVCCGGSVGVFGDRGVAGRGRRLLGAVFVAGLAGVAGAGAGVGAWVAGGRVGVAQRGQRRRGLGLPVGCGQEAEVVGWLRPDGLGERVHHICALEDPVASPCAALHQYPRLREA